MGRSTRRLSGASMAMCDPGMAVTFSWLREVDETIRKLLQRGRPPLPKGLKREACLLG